MYIALRFANPDLLAGEALYCLSHDVMQWSSKLWLVNLSRFMSYWQKRASHTNSSLVQVWKSTLKQACQDGLEDDPKSTSLTAPFCAALAPTPLAALWLHQAMSEQKLSGLLSSDYGLGQKIFRKLSWQGWAQLMTQLGEHLPGLLSKDLTRLQQTSTRLGISTPYELRRLNYEGVLRRFGSFLAQAWQWGFDSKASSLFAPDFPFVRHVFAPKPALNRHFDLALHEWQTMLSPLRDDLDQLATYPGLTSRLVWTLILDNMQELPLTLNFRYPYRLSKEHKKHPTALAQAERALAEAQHRHSRDLLSLHQDQLPQEKADTTLSSELLSPPLVVGWRLSLDERQFDQDSRVDILQNTEAMIAKDSLQQLQNEAPFTMRCYQATAELDPDASYREHPLGEDLAATKHAPSSSLIRCNLAAQKARPLFVYRRLQTTPAATLRQLHFVEAICQSWWHHNTTSEKNETLPPCERYFYRAVDNQGRTVWAYPDKQQYWQIKGVFG